MIAEEKVRVEGTVYDVTTGEPLSGAVVITRTYDNSLRHKPSGVKKIITDQQGRFQFTHYIDSKEQPLWCELEGYESELKEIRPDYSLQTTVKISMRKMPKCISGRVIDKNNKPVANANISAIVEGNVMKAYLRYKWEI